MYTGEKPWNEIFGENLKFYMRVNDYSTHTLAAKLDVSAMSISNWTRGKFVPNPKTLDRLCQILNVSREELTTDRAKIKNLSVPAAHPLPILGQICAGDGVFAEENFDGYFFIDNSIRADYTLRVVGDSMEDAGIHHGDIAFIRKAYDYFDGQIYAVLLSDTEYAVLKRVYKQDSGLLLVPCNRKYSPVLTSDAMVIGELVGTYHPI